jgi:hypothetical protein
MAIGSINSFMHLEGFREIASVARGNTVVITCSVRLMNE